MPIHSGSVAMHRIHLSQLKRTETLTDLCRQIVKGAQEDGSFLLQQQGHYSTEATLWAALALKNLPEYRSQFLKSANFLAGQQLEDGRLLLDGKCSTVFWLAAPVVLVWHGLDEFLPQQDLAIQFLLANSGVHYPRKPQSPSEHDTSIRGWPWVADTHSWIDPTAMALMALQLVNHEKHPRAEEAVRMILDRQLPQGGWNYGNTKVFGNPLKPLPENTACALAGLAGYAEFVQVERSLDYLLHNVKGVRTPHTLSWSVIALSRWKMLPAEAAEWLMESAEKADYYGGYSTAYWSMLAWAWQETQLEQM